AFSTRLDRYQKIVLPLAVILGQSTIGGTLRSTHPLYKDPTHPGVSPERRPQRCGSARLDWADTHHDVEVLDEAGKRVGARRFAHSHDGLNELKPFLLRIAPSPENLACIVETNHGLLISFLLSAGIPVYPVNPKMGSSLRKVAGAKTDQIDAHLLAKM